MLPTLAVGTIALPTYPFFLLVAFWAGLWLAARRATRLGLDSDHIYNAGLYGLLAGIIGARLWFVLTHWENYAADLAQLFSLSRSTLSAGAGVIIAGIVSLIYIQRNHVPLGDFGDALAPGLALALAIGHMGAFLGGEALGAPSSVLWAIEIAGVARHPYQLYNAIASFIMLAVLLLNQFRPWPGFHFWVFVILYALARLLLEIFRANPPTVGDGYLIGQILGLIAMVVALVVMAYKFTGSNYSDARHFTSIIGV